MPFGDIREARLERDPNQFVMDHPQRGPMVRLVIATSDGPLPMGALYTYSTKGMEKAAAAIKRVHRPPARGGRRVLGPRRGHPRAGRGGEQERRHRSGAPAPRLQPRRGQADRLAA
ncbi:MAG: hypothetical protein WDO13_02675 [Verrucomicrobiota bacterium]